MKDRRSHPEPSRADAMAEETVERDLASLRSVTGDRLPSLASQAQAARRGAPTGRSSMSGMRLVRLHPWRAGVGVAVALALAFLLIPVSYNRTTGQEVTLRFAAPDLQMSGVTTIAGKFRNELGGGDVQLLAEESGNGPEYVLKAFVPAGAGVDAQALGHGFAAALQASGYRATSQVTPRVERVSGSVYAMARDQVIRISTDGKSAGELETEIRDRLLEAGVPNPEVSVTDEAGKRRVEVTSKIESTDGTPLPEEPVSPQIVLTKDGQDMPVGEGCQVRVKKVRTDEGLNLTVDVTWNGTTAQAVVANPEALGDAGLAATIESQLHAAGMDVTVHVEDSKIEVTPNH